MSESDGYDYSEGLFYTILPNGIPDPLPPQQKYMSSGTHRGIFVSEEEAKVAILNDAKTWPREMQTDDYFFLSEFMATENDLHSRYSGPPDESDKKGWKFVVNNDEFVAYS